jgi:hypothetical protein
MIVRAFVRVMLMSVLAYPLVVVAKDDPEVDALNRRLAVLQSDPNTAELAQFERLQAQQAVMALSEARRRDRDAMRFLADRRVEIAEISTRTAIARRDLEQLEATRSDLLIEASRREAAHARQEAERLRVQSQIQAEESERLRQATEAETLARQDAELALTSVAGQQVAKLDAAQQKAAKLAREEAELVAGAKLPQSRFEARGEVFSLPAAAYSGSKLTSETGGQVKALAEYLQIGKKGRVSIVGYGADGQRRGQALSDALVTAGVNAGRLKIAAGKAAASKAKAVEIVIAP